MRPAFLLTAALALTATLTLAGCKPREQQTSQPAPAPNATTQAVPTPTPEANPTDAAPTTPTPPIQPAPQSKTPKPPETKSPPAARTPPPPSRQETERPPAPGKPAAPVDKPGATPPAPPHTGATQPPAAPAPSASVRVTPAPSTKPPAASTPAPAAPAPASPAPPSPPPAAPTAPAPAAPAPAAPAGPQIRGLWVDAFGPGFKTPEQVTKLVADAQAARVNVLFVQAVKRGDCYCNNASVPRTDDPEVPEDYDPLADVIQKAHAAGLQVHAWIITTSVVNTEDNPAPSHAEHVFNTHGLSAEGRDAWLTTQQDGTALAGKDYVLDPGHPDAAAYIAEMYASIARNYAVDGVQLDRIRYPDTPVGGVPVWGYNPTALERYRAESGQTGTPAPTDPKWTAWRRQQITNLQQRVYDAVKAVKPNVWVSAATITYGTAPRSLRDFQGTRTYAEILQDWPAWLRSGSVDLVILMNYKRDTGDQGRAFDGWNDFARRVKGNRRVAVGTAMYLNTPAATLSQTRRALASGLDGWVGYSYRTPDVNVFTAGRAHADAWAELTAKFTGPGGPFERDATPPVKPGRSDATSP